MDRRIDCLDRWISTVTLRLPESLRHWGTPVAVATREGIPSLQSRLVDDGKTLPAAACTKGRCSCVVYTCALKGFLYPYIVQDLVMYHRPGCG